MNLLKHTVILLFTTSISLTAFAKPNMQNQNMFNTQTVETVKGEIKTLDTCKKDGKEMPMGVCFTLKTQTNNLSIHVGPSWYLANKNFKLNVGDKLEVTGSKVTINKEISIIAKELKKDTLTLKLRDENGFPLWSKGKRNNR
jgi:hypothetical protein